MLSPSMITSSKGKVACSLVICPATSYWALSPVPLSPIAANFNESDRFGSAAAPATRPATAAAATTSVERARPGEVTDSYTIHGSFRPLQLRAWPGQRVSCRVLTMLKHQGVDVVD